jgi:hypothetical protein
MLPRLHGARLMLLNSPMRHSVQTGYVDHVIGMARTALNTAADWAGDIASATEETFERTCAGACFRLLRARVARRAGPAAWPGGPDQLRVSCG